MAEVAALRGFPRENTTEDMMEQVLKQLISELSERSNTNGITTKEKEDHKKILKFFFTEEDLSTMLSYSYGDLNKNLCSMLKSKREFVATLINSGALSEALKKRLQGKASIANILAIFSGQKTITIADMSDLQIVIHKNWPHDNDQYCALLNKVVQKLIIDRYQDKSLAQTCKTLLSGTYTGCCEWKIPTTYAKGLKLLNGGLCTKRIAITKLFEDPKLNCGGHQPAT